MKYADGSKYHGEFHAGARAGQGTFYYANGDLFTGCWKGGKQDGQGQYIFKASGAVLAGSWSKGVMTEGTFTDKFGNEFKGDFSGDAANLAYGAGGQFTAPSGATAIAA